MSQSMHQRLHDLQQSRPLRYLLIGGVSYVVEMAVLLLLVKAFPISSTLAVALSFWVGLIASFALQKYIAFENTGGDRKTFGKQALLYGALVLFNYGFTLLFVGLFAVLLGLITARTFALLLTVCWNYFAYIHIFKKD
jgi:putative flippase GtrA